LDLAGVEVDALDPSAAVVRRQLRVGDVQPDDLVERPTAAVTDVQRAVGTDGRPVRAAARGGDLRLRAVGLHPGEAAAAELGDDDAAVGHGDGPFGESQT